MTNGAKAANNRCYDGPAGVHLTREDAQLILSCLPVTAVELRERIKRYLRNDWNEKADARAAAIERGAI